MQSVPECARGARAADTLHVAPAHTGSTERRRSRTDQLRRWPFPDGGNLAGSKAAVLGVYAELDTRVNASRAAARAALRKAGLKHSIATFPNVDHAFFNPTSARHDPAAAAAAYRRMLSWFGTYLAT